MNKRREVRDKLDAFYEEISSVILSRQNPCTGLLPASTAVNVHGDYTDAWVRDNVYSIMAVWALALAHSSKLLGGDDDQPLLRGRTYELQQSVVKLMRGLLFCMMRQAHKVEAFKNSHTPWDALHAKYNTSSGDTVVADNAWGHLQLDATSLYVLMLAQMTTSGLRIIFTLDEVDFIQNLVYYIDRTYRSPDYGIWERGNKINNGRPELNTSSVGMAKAALEAINGIDLFGASGSPASIIHVLGDEIARNRVTLDKALPRESSSKEIDSALLTVISFPAFAVEDQELTRRTMEEIVTKLKGEYGFKRFLRDGHQTVLEDKSRLHYEPWELKKFENIESEWPVFYTYMYLDGLFRSDHEQVAEYRERLEKLSVEVRPGLKLLPELYYVPEDRVQAEKLRPHSQPRLPNNNVPLVWAQSLWYVGRLIDEGLLALGDIDPLGRHLNHYNREPRVQICLLAEDRQLQDRLLKYGISTQTPQEIEPVQLRPASALQEVYEQLGVNRKLGLSGRPNRPMGALATSRVLRINARSCVFIPQFMNQEEFYIQKDYHLLVDTIKSEITYIRKHWRLPGRPTVTLLLHKRMFKEGKRAFLSLIKELEEDERIRLGRMQDLLVTATTAKIDFLDEFEFSTKPITQIEEQKAFLLPFGLDDVLEPEVQKGTFDTATRGSIGTKSAHRKPLYNRTRSNSIPKLSGIFALKLQDGETNEKERAAKVISEIDKSDRILEWLHSTEDIEEQVALLTRLVSLKGLDFETDFERSGTKVRVRELVDEVYEKAGGGRIKQWSIVRQCAALQDKVVYGLVGCVTEILVQGKEITLGRSVSDETIIREPLSPSQIFAKIKKFCRSDLRDAALVQELLLYIGSFMRSEPSLFNGSLRLRVGFIIDAMMHELEIERLSLGHEYDRHLYQHMMNLSPFQMKNLLHQVLINEDYVNEAIQEDGRRPQGGSKRGATADPFDDIAQGAFRNEPHLAPLISEASWLRRRKRAGALHRVPAQFYPKVCWRLLTHVKGLTIRGASPKPRTLDSHLTLAENTPGEKNFALRIEWLLLPISVPEERQIIIEALVVLNRLTTEDKSNQASHKHLEPQQQSSQPHQHYIDQYIELDKLIEAAVAMAWTDRDRTLTSPLLSPRQKQRCDGLSAGSEEDMAISDEERRSFYYGISPERHAAYVLKALLQMYPAVAAFFPNNNYGKTH